MLSVKNAGISSGLGFGQGDDLLSQVENEILERRKKSLATTNIQPPGYGMTGIGSSVAPGAAMSPAIMSLLGSQNGGLGG